MLQIKKETVSKRKLKSLFRFLFNFIENNNNPNFKKNGEENFINLLLNSFASDMIIFDVGANIGSYSELLLHKCKEKKLNCVLHLFEPSQKNFKILEQKFKSNEKIYLNNFGISDKNSEAEIFYDIEGSSFASLYQRKNDDGSNLLNEKESIHIRRLDEYLKEKSLNKIDFLKLDIEGHEYAALIGLGEFLNPQFTKVIQFEYGGTNLDSKTTLRDLYFLLESKGYIVCKIMKRYIEKRNYNLNMENYQYSNYVALARELISD